MHAPKVSVIMPSLNVAPYIRECIESAVNQTLTDIEIICVDAGSTDGTLEILQEYAQKDSRVRVILSDIKSYGYQMNLGLDAATGEYIGVLETDDWAEATMFEVLWKAAKQHSADFVKSNFYLYTTKNGIRNEPRANLDRCPYGEVFSPADNDAIFSVAPSIWSGIYLREMLVANCVRFNETPGASYQDTSFYFMVCSVAQRCYLLQDCFLHYRRDNDGSSVHSMGKVFCIAEEMYYFEKFLDANPPLKEKLGRLCQFLKYKVYCWNLTRLHPQSGYLFLKLMHKELSAAFDAGLLCRDSFRSDKNWNMVMLLVNNPAKFFRDFLRIQYVKKDIDPAGKLLLLKESDCTDPQISVIVPFCNGEAYLEKCLESIIGQDLRNIEIICVDVCSTDGSRTIVERFADADSRIALVDTLVGEGRSVARNAGVSFSRGKYVFCIGCDGHLAPDALSALYAFAEKRKPDILYCGEKALLESEEQAGACQNAVDADQQTFVSGDAFLLEQFQNGLFRCCEAPQLLSRSFLEEAQMHLPQERFYEDTLFSCVLAAKARRILHTVGSFYTRQADTNASVTAVPAVRNCVNLCILSVSAGAIAVADRAISRTAGKALSLYAQKTLEDAREIHRKLPPAKQKQVAKLLPVEYQFFYTQMILEGQNARSASLAIRNSLSYKIGSAITFVPRKILGAVRSVKKNGLRHTLRLLFAKCKQWKGQ